jgi:hypothetical protein
MKNPASDGQLDALHDRVRNIESPEFDALLARAKPGAVEALQLCAGGLAARELQHDKRGSTWRDLRKLAAQSFAEREDARAFLVAMRSALDFAKRQLREVNG